MDTKCGRLSLLCTGCQKKPPTMPTELMENTIDPRETIVERMTGMLRFKHITGKSATLTRLAPFHTSRQNHDMSYVGLMSSKQSACRRLSRTGHSCPQG